MIGLADCNNFFVSCERSVNPELMGKAVVVLSNNDGCAIARSNEAKALGIKMGQPMFELRHLVDSGKLIALSGNHVLYHDISVRVHKIFRRFVPKTIDYSVDEAFLDVSEIPKDAIYEIGERIRNACWTEEHIPITVGFSYTKTLAKIATEVGKKSQQSVVLLTDVEEISDILERLPIVDVWGIGRRTARNLCMYGVNTASDLLSKSRDWVRKQLGINGVRTYNELKMIPCIDLVACSRTLQDSISESRTFPVDTSNFDLLRTRFVGYASHCAARLREMNGYVSYLTVFLRTNRFHTNEVTDNPSIQIVLDRPTDSTSVIANAAIEGLIKIFNPKIRYKRGGVVLSNITPKKALQPSLFDMPDDTSEEEQLMKVIDNINESAYHPALRLASQMGDGKELRNDGFSSSFQHKK